MGSDLNLSDEVDFIKNDINFAVDFIDASPKLPEQNGRIYINIQTKEKEKFCVELSSSGFKVVGKDFDDMKDENDHQKTYETVYSLLSNISSSYERTFGNELARKLANLQQETETQ
ncbi:GSK3-beta interaction protein-like [Rhopilema esculentum]|uniref:GSK3-beta interaction protein-like n=1 Tax=Rhopilema esculentum TaxID=499914 RepID=UPI0031DC6572